MNGPVSALFMHALEVVRSIEPGPAIPTQEEPGFKMTISLGQVFETVGFVGTVCVVWSKYAVRSALHQRDMQDLRGDVTELQNAVRVIQDTLRQLPAVLSVTHRNERLNRAILGHLRGRDIPVRQDEEDHADEDIQHAFEDVAALGDRK